MRSAKRVLVVVFAACAAGCSSAPAPVPVVGAAADIGLLAGEWSGEYQGETTQRSGTIVFKLSAGADSAIGDVLMIPRERNNQRLQAQDPMAGLPIARAPEVIPIAFVRAAGGGVTGQLDPYRDPDCDCTIITRFEGRITGDAIEGTYTSRRAEGEVAGTSAEGRTGVWKVTRRKS